MRKNYNQKYSWKQPISESVIEHYDNVYSFAVSWSGLTVDLTDNNDIALRWSQLRDFLHILSDKYPDFLVEHHLFREKDTEVIPAYIKNHEKRMSRGKDLAEPIVCELAEYYQQYARTNNVFLVVTFNPSKNNALHALSGILPFIKPKELNVQSILSRIEEFYQEIKHFYKGARMLEIDDYKKLVYQHLYRKLFLTNSIPNFDYRFAINEQWILKKPELTEDGFIEVDGVYSKVALLYLQPDANYNGFFRAIADLNASVHFSQTVVPCDTDSEIKKIDNSVSVEEEELSDTSKKNKKSKREVQDSDEFTSYVYRSGERIYKNVFIVTVHGEPQESEKAQKEKINNIIRALDVSVSSRYSQGDVGLYRKDKGLQLVYFRVSAAGMGYCSPFFRQDHTSQVINLAPVITFDKGFVGGESLRMSKSCQPVGFSRINEVLKHSMSVAMTRGGKGVEKTLEIIETFTQGMNWFGVEYGGTYHWVVDALKGNYIKANIETSINPFPKFSKYSEAFTKTQLNIRASTVEGIAFILLNKRWEYETSERAVAEFAFEKLYDGRTEDNSPLAEDFLNILKEIQPSLTTATQKDSCALMVSNLEDFLCTDAGRALNRQSNISFDNPITFIDFKEVALISKSQAVFLLNYAVMKFVQEAFLGEGDYSVAIDEVHKFIDIDAEATNNACKIVSRAGAKDSVWIDLITQGLTELQTLDSEVLGSISIKNFLYRQDQYSAIAERVLMPSYVTDVWSNLPNPLNANYRPQIKGVGDDWYHFHNIFPETLLDLASTSSSDLPLKNKIALEVDNVWERIEELRNLRKLKEIT